MRTNPLDALNRCARRLDFAALGVVPATAARYGHLLRAWLEAGFADEMRYMEVREQARSHPKFVLENVRSVVVLGLPIEAFTPGRNAGFATLEAGEPIPKGFGEVARFAGTDYHWVFREKLREMLRWFGEWFPEAKSRAVVDTAPLPEREWARRAGLGFVGRNRMLISPRLGSFFLLGEILTTAELPEYREFEESQLEAWERCCQDCGRCLKACPTGAISDKGVDSRRCIACLTIEHHGEIAPDLRRAMGSRLYGCDVCQEVCHHNIGRIPTRSILELSQAAVHPAFARAGEAVARNVRIVQDNQK
ncbi:MAG: tRNA epoxyqueuosine(34) reductase QueG [Planctomycetia bacterium]|nr:tRNA epoxyqueuosine(34) reductase QueG [Planctomycetia bacterium]